MTLAYRMYGSKQDVNAQYILVYILVDIANSSRYLLTTKKTGWWMYRVLKYSFRNYGEKKRGNSIY